MWHDSLLARKGGGVGAPFPKRERRPALFIRIMFGKSREILCKLITTVLLIVFEQRVVRRLQVAGNSIRGKDAIGHGPENAPSAERIVSGAGIAHRHPALPVLGLSEGAIAYDSSHGTRQPAWRQIGVSEKSQDVASGHGCGVPPALGHGFDDHRVVELGILVAWNQ